jgi:hypothetical protein
MSRAEARLMRQAQLLKVQAQEVARYSGVPPTKALLEETAKKFAAPQTVATGTSELPEITGIGRGRPSEYSEQTGAELCAWIAGGGSLRSWCREHGRDMQTVYRWLRENALFHALYARAHEDRADTLTDEMIELADRVALQPTIEGVAAAKLQVETRRWIATKLRPQKWGDVQRIEHQGNVSIRIGIPQQEKVIDVTPRRSDDPLLS